MSSRIFSKRQRSLGAVHAIESSILAATALCLLFAGSYTALNETTTFTKKSEILSLAETEKNWINQTNAEETVISSKTPCSIESEITGWTLYNPDLLPDKEGNCKSLSDEGKISTKNNFRDQAGILILQTKKKETYWLAVKKEQENKKIKAILFVQNKNEKPSKSLEKILNKKEGSYIDLATINTKEEQKTILDTNALGSQDAPQGQLPHDSIFGIKQLDTENITPGTSIAGTYTTDKDQLNDENYHGRTRNDSQTGFPTVLANGNFNITQGYNLTVADGLHITADTNTIGNDWNQSRDRDADHRSASYSGPTNNSIPGLIWDNAPNHAGGTSASGLMIYLSNDPTNGNTQRAYGEDIPPYQTVIATYNKNDGTHYPVGFEADGGIRAPVFYDSRSMSYLVDPSGTTHLGDLTLQGNSNYDTYRGQTTTGSVYLSGLGKMPWPEGWAKSGLIAKDIVVTASIAAGHNKSNTEKYMNSFLNSSGQGFAKYYSRASFFNASYVEVQGTHCLNDPMPYDNAYNSLPSKARDTITAGTIAKNKNTGAPLYCSSETGNWETVIGDQFTHVMEVRYGIGQDNWQKNYGRTTMFISSSCDKSPFRDGFAVGIEATIKDKYNSVTGHVRANTQEGGDDANSNKSPHISFMVPPGGSFMLDEMYGYNGAQAVFCSLTVVY